MERDTEREMQPTSMTTPLVGHDPDVFDRHTAAGWFSDRTLADRVAEHAARRPSDLAYISELESITWAQYDARSTSLAATLVAEGLEPGTRVAVLLPDGPAVHTAYLAAEKAGLVVVGIGPRAGAKEIDHLIGRTGARALVSHRRHGDTPSADLVASLRAAGHALDRHLVVPDDGALAADGTADYPVEVDGRVVTTPPRDAVEALPGRALGPNDLFLLNSTSGTTGMPKCVMQFQNRWYYFHQVAAEAGRLGPDDVFMSLVSAPFGFGLWTAHFTPTILGAPCVVMSRYSTEGALDLIERHGVTVLACVSTQFIMMLNSPQLDRRDLSALRAMFTGGEAVPYERAADFEERTGAAVLQFFGSNETGALSRTSVTDTREQRLGTAGRIIDEMEVRLLDDDGGDVTATGGPGQPACRGPATCLGYLDDPEANAKLFTPDGWMLTGDLATIDEDGYLRVVGRKSDVIIRGGKNISAAQVEAEVGTHPSVAMVAAVAKPDDVFGERVCVFVVPRPGTTVELDDLVAHLTDRGLSRELFPEDLVLLDEMPQASGGKIAKGALRDLLAARSPA